MVSEPRAPLPLFPPLDSPLIGGHSAEPAEDDRCFIWSGDQCPWLAILAAMFGDEAVELYKERPSGHWSQRVMKESYLGGMPRRKGAARAAKVRHHPWSAQPQDTGHSSPAKAMDAAGRGGLVAATQEAGKRLGIDALPPKVLGEGHG